MEVDEDEPHPKTRTKKHSHATAEQETQNAESPVSKKARTFSPKEFRKHLNQDNQRITALKQFLDAVNHSNGHNYVLEYLENGGNCIELLQTLELDSTIPPVQVFELVAHILLNITANGAQYHNAAYEACRYMLNNYLAIINKMISLSSSTQERKVCLKLLTAMVTFSTALAKDILVNVSFHSTNVELLVKSTGEENSVRDHFIHFLTAFLVNGSYPSLSILLDKKGFISSVIKGLRFDAADTVCVVISVMKNHILQNQAVSKTMKMKVFNTLVVRDIVNLYNWKGPAALKAERKNKSSQLVVVDEYSKSKVSECVHDFLLVLCTSYKQGVIFKDHSLGLSKKNQNALMYTVLESLERPWEHSYAGDLVIKICAACPDLAKTVWTSLKSSLEPRLTQKWLNALSFTKNLIRELQPSCVEFCVAELSVNQLAQAIQILATPLPIIKAVVPETRKFSSPMIKRHVMSLLLEMLSRLYSYLDASNAWLSLENHLKLKTFTASYVAKHFLGADTILSEWEVADADCDIALKISDEKYLETAFDIFDLYNALVPQLLDSLSSTSFELTDFLLNLPGRCTSNETSLRLQVKTVNIFLDLDPSDFVPDTELFSFTVPLMLRCYYETTDTNALTVLNKMLKYTGIFEGCFHEINIWINGVLNLKHFDEGVAQALVEILRSTATNIVEFSEELSQLNATESVKEDFSLILEKLKNTNLTVEDDCIIIKHKFLSPMVLGLFNHLKEAVLSKHYVNFVLINLFHCQTQVQVLKEFVQRYEVASNLKDYVLNWTRQGKVVCFKLKGKIRVFDTFSEAFLLRNDFANELTEINFNTYPDLALDLLQASIFYVAALVNRGESIEDVFENCFKYVKHLVETKLFRDSYVEVILPHPTLLKHFNLLQLHKSVCTKFLLDVIILLLGAGFDIERYLKIYKEKLVSAILKIVRKPKKYTCLDVTSMLRRFGLNYDQCCTLLVTISDLPGNSSYQVVLNVVSYALERLASLYESAPDLEPVPGRVIKKLTTAFVEINKNQVLDVTSLSVALQEYFQAFPHHIKHLDKELLPSLTNFNDYIPENTKLAVLLLERNTRWFDSVNLDELCKKKGLLLPILDVLIDKGTDENVLNEVFKNFQIPLNKVLVKPQKAGPHFKNYHKGLAALTQKFMPLEKCKSFADKVQKFEVTELFHVKLLESIFGKAIEDGVTSKQASNIILTFVHLLMTVFKRSNAANEDVAECFNNLVLKLLQSEALTNVSVTQNQVMKPYFMYSLKYGVSGQASLLKCLRNLLILLCASIEKEEAKSILDMLLSHSKFLDVVLDEHSPLKLEVLLLFLTLCQQWEELMERCHLPVLLAGYRAMVNPCDRAIWTLVKMYASKPAQTHFEDFKPFLWGKAAVNHYSLHQDKDMSLKRQPKMRDVLDTLEEDKVLSTIVSYPLNEELGEKQSYDLNFFLPLFSHLLAPEQQVQTYTFTRSGALSLTVVALSNENQKTREAACHVLSRFHFHVDANQRGKDNLLWLRYVEAVLVRCPTKKLNNFSAVYLARMALILTQPTHVMYVPLSQHLTAKASLDFSSVPELYTFLHSSDVNYKERRIFILELLRDGLRTEKDATDFLHSMAFKLFSELYNSSLADTETRLLILDIVKAVCRIPLGVKILYANSSLLTQLYQMVDRVLVLPQKQKQEEKCCVSKIISILLDIARTLQDTHTNFMVLNTLLGVVKDDIFHVLSEADLKIIFEALYMICTRSRELFTSDVLDVLLKNCDDKFCRYVVRYGCNFIDVSKLNVSDKNYYLRLLVVAVAKS
ncbi:hypothetical protein NQ315_000441 [Exocentrus adspersus]|uniref:Nucleolar pre-ribosomal-associated protein 1 n=1 Tax=Exocentrus adspersus TaxID=1586481 RepID=A0AAV8VLX2_9CUCU|nr:hypothetical protein NQ315_000441 [Exocentrus adspersus]